MWITSIVHIFIHHYLHLIDVNNVRPRESQTRIRSQNKPPFLRQNTHNLKGVFGGKYADAFGVQNNEYKLLVLIGAEDGDIYYNIYKNLTCLSFGLAKEEKFKTKNQGKVPNHIQSPSQLTIYNFHDSDLTRFGT